MGSTLTRVLLFSILATQAVSFGVIVSMLWDRAAAPQEFIRLSTPAGGAMPGSGSITLPTGTLEPNAPQPIGISEPASAQGREATKAGGPAGDRVQTVVEAEPVVSSSEALRQSNDTVDRALSAGVWSYQDNRTLRQHMLQLNTADRVALLEKISGAINRQQLRREDVP